MTIAVKGNRPLRIFAVMMLALLAVSHLMGQIDLTKVSFLWVIVVMALNAIQASLTGFCPMFKNARGECVACGVVCEAPSTEKSGGCCSDSSCNESACCDGEKTQQAGCCSGETSCCGAEETSHKTDVNKTPCCDQQASGTCCGGTSLTVKVLGTGCTTCNTTVKLIEEVAKQVGVKVEVVKVEDVAEIATYGVMSTPGIVINEKVVHAGGMPSREQVAGWLKGDA